MRKLCAFSSLAPVLIIYLSIYISICLSIYLSIPIEPRLSRQAASSAATQELSSILRNPKVHYRVHESPPLVTILGQINPVHTTTILSTKIYLDLSSSLFPYGLHTNTLHALLFAICATFPAHFILLDLVIPTLLGSSSLCNFLQPHATSFLFGTNILLSTPFSYSLSLRFSSKGRDQVSHP
jgi:hypothetical protein